MNIFMKGRGGGVGVDFPPSILVFSIQFLQTAWRWMVQGGCNFRRDAFVKWMEQQHAYSSQHDTKQIKPYGNESDKFSSFYKGASRCKREQRRPFAATTFKSRGCCKPNK